jgi:hypothetical protein
LKINLATPKRSMPQDSRSQSLIREVQRHFPTEVRTPSEQVTEKTHRSDRALARTNETANREVQRLQDQARMLLAQAEHLEFQAEVRRKVREARCQFSPVVGRSYFLYEADQACTLTMIAPEEWDGNAPYGAFLAEVQQLGDFTWNVVRSCRDPEAL